jgi:hypothetical protein
MKNNARKKIIIALIVILALLALLSALTILLDKLANAPKKESGETTAPPPIEFSKEYITDRKTFESDLKYMGYDRMIYYYDPQTGVSEGLLEDQYKTYGKEVMFLCSFIESIIVGDAERYNAMFSDAYYLEHDPRESFSMQKLYDIRIAPYTKSEGMEESALIYMLDYKIRRNNGSFRSDIDSDGSRTQYIYIREYNGEYRIDRIVSP